MDADLRTRLTLTQQRLAPLAFLLGNWRGEGMSDGAPLTGRLLARHILSQTFIEVRETLTDAAGVLDHEDLCLYRFDPQCEQVRVVQFQAPAWSMERPVVALPGGGVRWYDGPLGPQVVLRPDGEALRITVTLPGAPEPVMWMRYLRDD